MVLKEGLGERTGKRGGKTGKEVERIGKEKSKESTSAADGGDRSIFGILNSVGRRAVRGAGIGTS